MPHWPPSHPVPSGEVPRNENSFFTTRPQSCRCWLEKVSRYLLFTFFSFLFPCSIAGTEKVCSRNIESRNLSVILAFLVSTLWKFDAVSLCFRACIHSVLLPWFLVRSSSPAVSEHLRLWPNPSNCCGKTTGGWRFTEVLPHCCRGTAAGILFRFLVSKQRRQLLVLSDVSDSWFQYVIIWLQICHRWIYWPWLRNWRQLNSRSSSSSSLSIP